MLAVPIAHRALLPPSATRLSAWLASALPGGLADTLPLTGLTPVTGGCIHGAWRLELPGGGRLFAKISAEDALPVLRAEADGLRTLQCAAAAATTGQDLVVPAPLALGAVAGQAVLVLPWLPLAPRGDMAAWRRLGTALARLHRASRSDNGGRGFGFAADNAIGATPQANGWLAPWGRFFAERRLAPQLERLQRCGIRLAGSQQLLERLPGWLAGHAPDPVLVHGDLWSGNAGTLVGGGGALFDPAVHFADREVDLAMARLFGGMPAAFFAGYQEEWPLPADAEQRLDLYNLYHLLNHANLFDGGVAGGYTHQAEASIQRLLRRLG